MCNCARVHVHQCTRDCMPQQPHNNFLRYEDPTGTLSSRDLVMAQWFVRNRARLSRAFVIFLIVVNAMLYSIFFWKIGAYAIFGYTEDRHMEAFQAQTFPNYRVLQQRYRANDVVIGRPVVYPSSLHRSDFVVDVENPNSRFAADITYFFSYAGGKKTELHTAHILPGSSRPIGVFGVETDGFPSSVDITIEDISWQRISPHAIADVPSYMADHLDFSAGDITFVPASPVDGLASHRLAFDVTNNTAYSYWEPVFYVVLLQGNAEVGVVPITVDQFLAGSTRTIDIRLERPSVSVTGVMLFPAINILDEASFMPPQ